MEDVITDPEPVEMLDFKSEYEFLTGKSPMNGIIKILSKNSSIIDPIIENCKETYNKSPLICILEKD